MFEIIQKQKEIDLRREEIPHCWIYKESNQDLALNNYFKNTQLSDDIWLSGQDRKLLIQLINSIKKARNIICLSTFIFSSKEIKDELIEASKRGVRVYMITASNKHLKSLPEDDDNFNKHMYVEMSELFNELQGIVKIRTSENFHTKFLLIDPGRDEISEGYLLTSNFDTKGLIGRDIKGIYHVNQEIGIFLNKREVEDLFKQFCLGFWELSKEESKVDGFYPLNSNIQQNFTFNNLLLNSPNHKSLKNEIINIISSTRGKIFISTYGITDDNEIYNLILNELVEKKREVFILTRPRVTKMESLIKLSQNGAKIYGHYDIHAKLVIVENINNPQGIVMTANIDNISFENSFETGKILDPVQARTLLNVIYTWINYFPLELMCNIERGKLDRYALVWNRLTKTLDRKKVIFEKIEELKPEYASSILHYRNYEISNKKLDFVESNSEIVQKMVFKYKVKPPIKPVNAKTYLEEADKEKSKSKKNKKNFQFFLLNNQSYIVVKNDDELKEAIKITEKSNVKIVTLEKYLF